MDSYKTPFGDAVDSSPVPHKGSGSGSYDASSIPDTPNRDGGLIPELTFDTHWGEPKNSGPVTKSPFKDAIS
jgi:hypothetical protein